MSLMTIVVDVDDHFDPRIVDPHDVAQDLIDAANEDADFGGGPRATFVSAEWNV